MQTKMFSKELLLISIRVLLDWIAVNTNCYPFCGIGLSIHFEKWICIWIVSHKYAEDLNWNFKWNFFWAKPCFPQSIYFLQIADRNRVQTSKATICATRVCCTVKMQTNKISERFKIFYWFLQNIQFYKLLIGILMFGLTIKRPRGLSEIFPSSKTVFPPTIVRWMTP